MNALLQAQSAYGNTANPIRTDRDVEYEAFARVTHKLKVASKGESNNVQDLISAVYENRKLWTLLAADVAGEGNALSQDLRARILYLSDFTRTYSSRVLNGASAEPLIEVNTAVMRGLQKRGAGQ